MTTTPKRQNNDKVWAANRARRLAVRPIRPVAIVRNGRREIVR